MRSLILISRFSPRGLVQGLAQFGEALLKALGQARDDSRFLLLASGRMAIQAHFPSVGTQDLLHTDALARPRR